MVSAQIEDYLLSIALFIKRLISLLIFCRSPHHSLYQYAVKYVQNYSHNFSFQTSSYSVYQTLWKQSISDENNRVKNHEEGVRRAGKEKYIYIGEISGVAPYVFIFYWTN